MRLSSLGCALFGAAVVNAVPTITAVGNKFFDSNGKQFFMKGMREHAQWQMAVRLGFNS